MTINTNYGSNMSVGFSNTNNKTSSFDRKDYEVAKKLGIDYNKWTQMSDSEKQAQVDAWNTTHPNDQIEHKK